MARILQCPECFTLVADSGQRGHQQWHDDHNEPVTQVEVGNWPAANFAGDMDFRTPAI